MTHAGRLDAIGRCTRCGQIRDRTDRKRCARCRRSQCERDKKTHSTAAGRARVSAQRRARLVARAESGMCSRCGRQRDRVDRRHCRPCRHRESILAARANRKRRHRAAETRIEL